MKLKNSQRQLKRPLLIILIVFVACLGAGCIQQYALEPIVTVAGGRINTSPAGGRKVGIRVNMVGTSTDNEPGTSDYAFCDVEGDFTLVTQRLGRGYVVARGDDYDIGYDNVYLPKYGDTDSVDRLIPATDSVTLFTKTPGEALFLVFEQDFGTFTSVDLVGDFNGMALNADARAMHDDGSLIDLDATTDGMQTSGDYEAGDGVWTLRTKLDAGDQSYGFVFNKEGDVHRDPYEEKSSSSKSVISVK
jgi:hypothetical protein